MDDQKSWSITNLIAELASPNAEQAEDAQYGLQTYGTEAIPELLAAIPSLPEFGQLCAIDVIEACDVNELRRLGQPSVAQVLIPLLRSENEVVQWWAATTLSWLGDTDTIPALESAQQALKVARVHPAAAVRDVIRNALTHLGARKSVLPMQADQRLLSGISLRYEWSIADFDVVVRALAAEQQVVLYFQIWESRDGHFYWQDGWNNKIDLHLPWSKVVERSMQDALVAGRAFSESGNLVVSIEWIDESDL